MFIGLETIIYKSFVSVNYIQDCGHNVFVSCFYLQFKHLEEELTNSKQKYSEIVNGDYQVMKNYLMERQNLNEDVQSVSEKNVSNSSYLVIFLTSYIISYCFNFKLETCNKV